MLTKKSRNVEQDGVPKLKSIRDLATNNLRKKENLKSVNIIEIRTKAQSLNHGDHAVDNAIVTFRKSCVKYYVKLLHTYKLIFHSLII